jgi:lycopene cyclase domain-containing protein
MEKYYYLLINIFMIFTPIVRGFEARIRFLSRWKGLLLGVAAAGMPFIIWDIVFTKWGIWGFNPRYLTGIRLINLPIEEWLFFVTAPIACIFIYEVLIFFIKRDLFKNFSYPLSYALIPLLIILGIIFRDLWYTGLTFILAGAYLAFIVLIIKPKYLGRFYLGYAVSLFPFLLVNGILTGSFIPEEIVWYNNAENLSIRIFTVPIEDSVYMFLLLLINISVYEHWKEKNNRTTF